MFNNGLYNGVIYNGVGEDTIIRSRFIRNRWITSDIPHSSALSTVLQEINISDTTPYEFIDKIVESIFSTAIGLDTGIFKTATESYEVSGVDLGDQRKMEKDLRDILKEFEW